LEGLGGLVPSAEQEPEQDRGIPADTAPRAVFALVELEGTRVGERLQASLTDQFLVHAAQTVRGITTEFTPSSLPRKSRVCGKSGFECRW